MRGHQGQTWYLETIKQGIDRFVRENNRLPKAWDFDLCGYLPSARTLQRSYGGLERVRSVLGYDELNYTKGTLRSTISMHTWAAGLSAEDTLEELLTGKFGEPYVHTQRRYYKKLRNRYDFFVYYDRGRFGVDIFTTSRPQYINNNVRHKIAKYKDVPMDVPIFFVVSCPDVSQDDVNYQASRMSALKDMSNITVIHETEFVRYIQSLKALNIPNGFVTAL